MFMKLSELPRGKSAKIVSMDLPVNIKDRLNRVGLTAGVRVIFVRRAPFGGPLEFKVRDFYLALRKEQADKIEIEIR